MSLSDISPDLEKKELAVQSLINSHIENNESMVFNAGAGSGKTYALSKSLKYIINSYGKKLEYHKQKIMCITYTNVATNEIRNYIGNSDLVKVSTIHERLWSLIKGYKKELISIHVEKLKSELDKMHSDFNENGDENLSKQFKAYRELSSDQKDDFRTIMVKRKDQYNKNYDKPAKEFRQSIEIYLTNYPNILSNVTYFKKIVNMIYKVNNYKECLEQIESANPKFKEVRYEDKYNNDILHKMIISHDTLLEYALNMVKTYDLFKRIILDNYPYILIDEYQDTNKSVVEIMKLIEDYANGNKRKIFIGYFGDSAQNIYKDGVGDNLISFHPGLKIVNKKFNRRSHSEIIDVINIIRNDEIKQVSIYDDSTGGSVKFYIGSNDVYTQFIEEYKKKWCINSENQLHCLVLLNKYVAQFNGFPKIYEFFADTTYYKKYYDRINNELLSNEQSKLGNVPNLIYRILQFKNDLNNSDTSLSKIIDRKIYSKKMTFLHAKKLITTLNAIKGNSLGEYLQSLFEKYTISEDKYLKLVVKDLIKLERYSYHDFTNYLLDELFLNYGSERIEDFKIKLDELFERELFLKLEESKKIKQDLDQLFVTEFFTYIDLDETKEFQSKLHKLFSKQKLEKLITNDEVTFLIKKLDKLFDDEIFSVIDVDEVDIAKEKLNKLLNLDFKEWDIWYKFINDTLQSDIIYHTYHGTKGAEYNNVIIIMQNDFGKRDRNKFSSFFKNYKNSKELQEKELMEFINTRNLFYVSCSRAITNLRILYLDDVSDFEQGIKSIFGEIYKYHA